MNPNHRRFLKNCCMGDKEALSSLTMLYYDTEPHERLQFLDQVMAESNKTRARLKELELQKLEDEERQIGAIVDAAEEARTEKDNLRGEGARRDDEAAGEGGDAGGPGGPALPDDAPRLQLP